MSTHRWMDNNMVLQDSGMLSSLKKDRHADIYNMGDPRGHTCKKSHKRSTCVDCLEHALGDQMRVRSVSLSWVGNLFLRLVLSEGRYPKVGQGPDGSQDAITQAQGRWGASWYDSGLRQGRARNPGPLATSWSWDAWSGDWVTWDPCHLELSLPALITVASNFNP